MKLTLTIENLEMTYEEVEEKLCHQCGEYWPATDEFFYRKKGDNLWSPCKACIAERRRRTNASKPCCVPGCKNPRDPSLRYSRCREHLRETYRLRKAVKK